MSRALSVTLIAATFVALLFPSAARADTLVVALHSWGGTPAGIRTKLPPLPVGVRVLAPHGALRVGRGFAWMESTFRAARPDEMERQAVLAAERVAEAIEENCGPETRIVVIGHSQGGMVALTLAVRRPDLVDSAISVAGAFPSNRLPISVSVGNQVVLIHGESDPYVPRAAAERTYARLRQNRYGARLYVEPTGHAFRGRLLRRFRRVLLSILR